MRYAKSKSQQRTHDTYLVDCQTTFVIIFSTLFPFINLFKSCALFSECLLRSQCDPQWVPDSELVASHHLDEDSAEVVVAEDSQEEVEGAALDGGLAWAS